MAINFLQNDLISLLEQNETPKNLSGIYGTDLTKQELAAGIKPTTEAAGTPTYKIPEFDRYAFAPRDYGALPSMYELYLSGGFDAAQDDFVTPPADTTPVDTNVVGGGGGGGNLLDQLETDTGINTPFEQNLIDQGVGVQIAPGQPVVAPGEMPVTQEEMDAFNQIPVTPANLQDPTTMLPQIPEVVAQDPTTMIPQLGSETPSYIGGERTLADAGAGIDDVYGTDYQGEQIPEEQIPMGPGTSNLRAPGQDVVTNLDTTPDYSDVTTAVAPPSILNPEPAPQTTFGDPVDVQQGFTADPIDFSAPGTLADPAEKQDIESLPAQEQNNLLSNIANQLGGIWDSASKTIDIAGQKINPFVVGVKGAINKYIFGGFPATLIFDALGAMNIEPGYSDQTKAAQYMGLVKEGETQDIYGINTQSMFGDYDEYNVDRVDELETALEKARGKYDTEQEYLDMTTRLRQELEDRKSYNRMASGDIDDDPTGDAQIAEIIARDDRIDAGIEAADEEPAPSGDRSQEVDAGTADVQDYADIYEPPTPAVTGPTYGPHGNGGGGGGGGGGNTGGGYSRGDYGGRGHHWAKGGRVKYLEGGIVSLKNAKR